MDTKCEKLFMADEKYANGKISVWWDIENCAVPKACNPDSIAQNISSALAKVNYCGPISISAYGNIKGISESVQHALNSTGISLNHVPAGVKDASDKKILVDMLLWAVDNPAPATYLLISGDRDFSNALHQLRMRRYNILLAQPRHASAPLVAAAKSVWRWSSLLAGQPPLTDGESAQFVSHISTSVPLQTQSTKVNPADSSCENSNPGNKKLPEKGCDVSHEGKQVCENHSQPIMSSSSNQKLSNKGSRNNVRHKETQIHKNPSQPSSSNAKKTIAVQAALVVNRRLTELEHIPLKRSFDGSTEQHGGKFPRIQQIYPPKENPSQGHGAPHSPHQHNGDTQCSPSPTPGPCDFCRKRGHMEESCRRKHGLCLRCGSSDHPIRNCPESDQHKTDRTCSTKATPFSLPPPPSTAPAPVDTQTQTPGPCTFCKKSGHIEKFCRRKHGLCLGCGSSDHSVRNCPESGQPETDQTCSTKATLYSLPPPSSTAPAPADTQTPGPCNFCRKSGHMEESCRRKHGLCLRCGSPGHSVHNCPEFGQPKTDQTCSTEATPYSIPPPPAPAPAPPDIQTTGPCNFCRKSGHIEKSCRRKHGLCLCCGSPDHAVHNCPEFGQPKTVQTSSSRIYT